MLRRSCICLALVALGTTACPAQEDRAEPVKVDPAARKAGKADGKAGEAKAADGKAANGKADAGKPKSAPLPKDRDRSMGKTYDEELATLRRRVEQQVKRTEKVKGYLPWQMAGQTALQVAKLTGDYTEYKKAEELIDKTYEIGGKHGADLLRAQFNYQMHRLDRIEADLPTAKARASAAGGNKAVAAVVVLEGNLAMQRGQYDKAQELWAQAERLSKGAADYAYALWWFRTGEYEKAEERYAFHARNYHAREAEGAAWLDLIQAIMDLDRGRYDDALAHLDDADKDMSGYWLVDEHRAEITALKGDTKTAETMYREIIDRTNNPEFMDALASILAETGREEESKQWVDKATTRFEEQLKLYPEASYGHALGHYLDFGPPERALELAEKNHKLRPNVAAKILLAQAQLGVEKVAAAKKTIDAALKTPWSSADLFHTASEVYAASGDETKAQELLTKAKAINPHVADE